MSTASTTLLIGPKADNTNGGICTNCGKCCSDILPLTPWDINRIKEYVRRHSIEPIAHDPNLHWDPPIDDTCPFFNPFVFNGRHCTIYPVRPIICKHYLCRGFTDPILHARTYQAIMEEAMKQPAVKQNPAIFLTPSSLRYSIWPHRFPEYKDIRLKFKLP